MKAKDYQSLGRAAARAGRISKPRKKPTYVETPIHKAIVEWLETMLPKTWIVHHSPNTRKLKPQTGKLFKRMGTKAGFPDIIIMGVWTSSLDERRPEVYFVEVKAPNEKKSKLSETQIAFAKKARTLGFEVEEARSIEDMRRLAYEWNLPIREAR